LNPPHASQTNRGFNAIHALRAERLESSINASAGSRMNHAAASDFQPLLH
jgi:hypothetical protein